jgi:hypothetical protein
MNTTTMDLSAAANAEARRLAVARTHAGCSGDLVADGPSIARARGAARRRALNGKTLCIWQVACADTFGRTHATAIVAMMLGLDLRQIGDPPRRSIRRLVEAIELSMPPAVERLLRARADEIAAPARAHARARLARERAIAARVANLPAAGAAYQPGLFDRRSERAHRLHAADAIDFAQRAHARIDAASAAAAISPAQPTLLLVLMP